MSTFARLALVFALQLTPVAAFAQSADMNRLDCWLDDSHARVECPPVTDMKTGRSARVTNTFSDLGGEIDTTPVPIPAPKPGNVDDEPRKARHASNTYSGRQRCTGYKSYNPATKTYRSYDGVTRACR